jgi:hypothetical protein
MLPISGTFLDEITHNIPSQNWGRDEWSREFQLYSRIGIDTVIIIRAGYQNKCIFQAQSVPGLLPAGTDLAEMFLDLAEENGLNLYFGTFDSGEYWVKRQWRQEADLNRRFIDEVVERYGDRKALKGWYLCHETSGKMGQIIDLYNTIGGHCKQLKDLPCLISPYPRGGKQFKWVKNFNIAKHTKDWGTIFSECSDIIDICAFQDGQMHYHELPAFHKAVKDLGDEHGITIWSNIESFDRDMPIKFPPADWRRLKLKMEQASQHAEKLITFEFPHFMSPQSSWESGRNLFKRYAEMHDLEVE